jgi:glutamyl/glutaminyl-tRNA synthetase
VDDHLMQISHVIRGEDGLSNTPRQCLLYDALSFERPISAHLPFLLGRDRKKLSKRNADTVSLLDFGHILPDAMFNYLSQLGWNPGGGETQEIFSRDDLIEKFTLEGVNKAGAIFDVEKLGWMNIAYLKRCPSKSSSCWQRPIWKPWKTISTKTPNMAAPQLRWRANAFMASPTSRALQPTSSPTISR